MDPERSGRVRLRDFERSPAGNLLRARLQDLPQDVVTLGKKSILDGLGLALSGGASHCGALVRQQGPPSIEEIDLRAEASTESAELEVQPAPPDADDLVQDDGSRPMPNVPIGDHR